MDEMQIIGIVVSAVITLGGFIAVIMKFVQPINDLRVVIQKLNDNIDSVKHDNEAQAEQIKEHKSQIGTLDDRVGKVETKVNTLETKMKIYHDS